MARRYARAGLNRRVVPHADERVRVAPVRPSPAAAPSCHLGGENRQHVAVPGVEHHMKLGVRFAERDATQFVDGADENDAVMSIEYSHDDARGGSSVKVASVASDA